MNNFEYLNPFSAGKIFLSHRCVDHKWSHYLAQQLGKHFDVYYSCDGSMLLDDPVIPRQQLVASDLVVFLASPSSLATNSIAKYELSIAEILTIKGISSLAMVRLESTKIPEEYGAFSFGQFRWANRRKDSTYLIDAIKRKLADSAGLIGMKFPKAHKGTIYFSQLDHPNLVNRLHDYDGTHILPFNAPLQAFDMAELIRLITAQPENRKQKIIENLFNIYFSTNEFIQNAKQNAIFLLGKLLSDEEGHAKKLLKKMPDFEKPFLLRGYEIALSFLPDAGLIDDYVLSLAQDTSPEWEAQRVVNRKFHIIYYNGVLGALTELRNTISTGKPLNLLALNVFTLGEMSKYQRDADLLESYEKKLVRAGVSKQFVHEAVKKIRLSHT